MLESLASFRHSTKRSSPAPASPSRCTAAAIVVAQVCCSARNSGFDVDSRRSRPAGFDEMAAPTCERDEIFFPPSNAMLGSRADG